MFGTYQTLINRSGDDAIFVVCMTRRADALSSDFVGSSHIKHEMIIFRFHMVNGKHVYGHPLFSRNIRGRVSVVYHSRLHNFPRNVYIS